VLGLVLSALAGAVLDGLLLLGLLLGRGRQLLQLAAGGCLGLCRRLGVRRFNVELLLGLLRGLTQSLGDVLDDLLWAGFGFGRLRLRQVHTITV
jgi:hypothetical protein